MQKVYEIKTSTETNFGLFLGYNVELRKNVTIFRDGNDEEIIYAVAYPTEYGKLKDITETLEYVEGIKMRILSEPEKSLANKLLDGEGL